MEEFSSLGKRKTPESSVNANVTETPKSEPKRRAVAQSCVREVAIPNGYASAKDEVVHGTLSDPVYNGTMAKTYQFNLDPFQQVSITCLERNESVLVSAHTSAGKLPLQSTRLQCRSATSRE